MAGRHGTLLRYDEGCRCGDCTEANRVYFRRRREAKSVAPAVDALAAAGASQPSESGLVETAVRDEIGGLATEARPGLAQRALALARLMDNPRAINQQPAAAKVLASMLEKLRQTSARDRRRGLALVRTMTQKGGA